jgi:hypothetical protein
MSSPSIETTTDPTTIDRVCSALASKSRRAVLAYFDASATQTASLDEVAEYVAARQSASDTRTPEQVQVRLHHVGLPKLDDAGLIDYDARTATVRYREQSTVEEWDALVAEALE